MYDLNLNSKLESHKNSARVCVCEVVSCPDGNRYASPNESRINSVAFNWPEGVCAMRECDSGISTNVDFVRWDFSV